ncbi:DUF6169 family protein [Chitinophaga sp. Cy-1792]|uniref:DUF6169 family protein n=1 Tax=Chitinophaga sp. Cy-1792 TaxID=2608339 RepID=UPI00141FFFF7|nr:DUF6169 family protein [Chitinophaga sp. Cy-1792]NIG57254.1 hypothetical protein [Chitinophaga sp. Cy-1792]
MKPWMLYAVECTSDDECSFSTTAGVIYKVAFSDYYLYDCVDNEVKCKTIVLSREPPNVRGMGCNYKDERVFPTIGSIIMRYLENNPDEAVVFLCDNRDKLAKARFRLFDRWFNSQRKILTKSDTNEKHHLDDFCASIFMRRDNLAGPYYKDAFRWTLERCFPEEIWYPVNDEEWFMHQDANDNGEFPFHVN